VQVIWDQWESPVGLLTLAATEKGLCYLGFHDDSLEKWCKRYLPDAQLTQDPRGIEPYLTQLDEYFQGMRTTFTLSLEFYGTPFQKRVWGALQQIPYGEVCSYKDIAVAIHSPKAVRAVGGANNKNPIPIIVPCHRVIGTNGQLVGYGGGLDKKEQLLALEQK
jgi:methylated-DNA-[protein]-cysteine S-methyltransferase